MSLLKKTSSPVKAREYKSKEFITIPRLNNGDYVKVVIHKDGKLIESEEVIVMANEMIEKHRLRFIIQDWTEENEI